MFGGISEYGLENDLHGYELLRLNLETLTWEKLESGGQLPLPKMGSRLDFHENYLYLTGGETYGQPNNYKPELFRYDLTDQVWEDLTSSSMYTNVYLHGTCVYSNYLYIFYGWSNELSQDVDQIARVSLESGSWDWETLQLQKGPNYHLVKRDSFGFAKVGSHFYMFGGYSESGIRNSLVQIDLDSLQYSVVSEDFEGPSERAEHSLMPILGKFYLFGGKNQGEKLGDFWVFDPLEEEWSELKSKGNLPSPRSSYAPGTFADNLVVWGGETEEGLANDAHIYNAYSNNWKLLEVRSSSAPSPRKGACLGVAQTIIYVFGGEDKSGPLADLWKFDTGAGTYELLSEGSFEGPGKVAYAECSLEGEKLYVMYGSSESETPLGMVYYFDLPTKRWKRVFDNGYSEARNRAGANIQKIGNKVFVAGGQIWSIRPFKSFYLLDLETNKYIDYPELPDYSFSAASTYFKSNLYIHGGSATSGAIIRRKITTNKFYKINLNSLEGMSGIPCSPGTYQSGEDCILCPKGSYSSEFGQTSCKLCPAGTFNFYPGAVSISQCYLCPKDQYNPEIGKSQCLDCQSHMECPVGTISPSNDHSDYQYKSIQPLPYNDTLENKDQIVLLIQITVVLVGVIILGVVLSKKRFRNLIKLIDLFERSHNHKNNEPVYIKKNAYGGFFSLVFVFAAMFLVSETIIDFFGNNLQETKTLVPFVVLENEQKQFNAELEIHLNLLYYRGDCVKDQECHPLISIEYQNIQGSFYTSCTKDNFGCAIEMTCNNCEILTGSTVDLSFKEVFSYASGIELNLTSSSSIPDQKSSVVQYLEPSGSKVFRGPTPSIFLINSIPSVTFT